jgi:hypothetical protein
MKEKATEHSQLRVRASQMPHTLGGSIGASLWIIFCCLVFCSLYASTWSYYGIHPIMGLVQSHFSDGYLRFLPFQQRCQIAALWLRQSEHPRLYRVHFSLRLLVVIRRGLCSTSLVDCGGLLDLELPVGMKGLGGRAFLCGFSGYA